MTFSFNPPADYSPLKISILADTPKGWIMPWIEILEKILKTYHDVRVHTRGSQMGSGDIAFFLGCTQLVGGHILDQHRVNLVVHESNLPEGRGFSPVAWQVSQGRNSIPVCLFQAAKEADAGPVYLRDRIKLDGTELLPEIRAKQGEMTIRLCLRFLEEWPDIQARQQQGQPTQFPRRTRQDDRLPVDLPLEHLFDRLRVVDNDQYPAWFEYRGRRYLLRIDPMNREEGPLC